MRVIDGASVGLRSVAPEGYYLIEIFPNYIGYLALCKHLPEFWDAEARYFGEPSAVVYTVIRRCSPFRDFIVSRGIFRRENRVFSGLEWMWFPPPPPPPPPHSRALESPLWTGRYLRKYFKLRAKRLFAVSSSYLASYFIIFYLFSPFSRSRWLFLCWFFFFFHFVLHRSPSLRSLYKLLIFFRLFV